MFSCVLLFADPFYCEVNVQWSVSGEDTLVTIKRMSIQSEIGLTHMLCGWNCTKEENFLELTYSPNYVKIWYWNMKVLLWTSVMKNSDFFGILLQERNKNYLHLINNNNNKKTLGNKNLGIGWKAHYIDKNIYI